MRLHRVLLALALTAAFAVPGVAQDLRDLLTGFLREGITLAPPNITPNPCLATPPLPTCHVAHFDSVPGQFQAVDQLNQQIALQLSSFPLPSSSGGFTYRYDPGLGTFTRAADSFGPIYAERAETIGKGFFNFGVNYSHFSYDRLNDLELDGGDVKVLFLHLPSADPHNTAAHLTPWFRGDVISGTVNFTVSNDITAFVGTYGITNWLDVGFAVPLVHVSLEEQSELTIERLATENNVPEIHRFAGTDANCAIAAGSDSAVENCNVSGSATGLGDVLFRAKARLASGRAGGIALATDVRFPTGNEEDLLGLGVTQIKGYLIASAHIGIFSPHLNGGYTWAIHRHANQPPGSPGVPDEWNYTGGFDIAIGSRVTFAGDVIGRTYRNTQIVGIETTNLCVNPTITYTPPAGATCATDPNLVAYSRAQVAVTQGDLNTLIGSAGFKINPFANLLVTINGLFSITKKGLQDNFTPMVAVEYAF